MTEPNNRELNDKIADIREWLVRIDTKVDFFNDVKHTAERAELKADKALQQSEDNAKDIVEAKLDLRKEIDGIRTTAKWAIGLILPAIVAIGIAAF